MALRVGRRFFLALGVGRYCHLPAHEQLGQVPTDVRAMRELFTGLGYHPVLSGLGEYDTAEQIRQRLRLPFLGDRPVVLSTREGNGVYVHDIVTRASAGGPLVGHTNGVHGRLAGSPVGPLGIA
jgi:hypothetical protein